MDTATTYALATVAVMILAGVLGSYCRYFFEKSDGQESQADRSPTPSNLEIVIPGIVASFVVPLFLSVGKSEVFTNAVNGKGYAENIFIVFAFCLLAAVSARSFVSALARQALQKADSAERKADEALEVASEEPKTITGPVGLQVKAIPEIEGSDQEKLVWHALVGGTYVRRSVTGIAKESKLDVREVRNALQNLVARGVVAENPSKRTGALLYQAKLDSIG